MAFGGEKIQEGFANVRDGELGGSHPQIIGLGICQTQRPQCTGYG